MLTINHVMEILVAYEQHRDWKQAFLDVSAGPLPAPADHVCFG